MFLTIDFAFLFSVQGHNKSEEAHVNRHIDNQDGKSHPAEILLSRG